MYPLCKIYIIVHCHLVKNYLDKARGLPQVECTPPLLQSQLEGGGGVFRVVIIGLQGNQQWTPSSYLLYLVHIAVYTQKKSAVSSFPSTNNFSSAREYYVQLSSLCQHLHLSKNLFAIVPQLIIYLICNFCIKKDKDRIFLKFQFQLFLSSERGNQDMV